MTPECRDVRDVMDSYVSGELLVETNHALLRHLAACRDCASELERRQRVGALLREGLNTPVDAEHLRRRVALALDRERPARFRTTWRWMSAAAVVFLVAAVFWFGRPVARLDAAAFRDSVGDHVACALSMPAGVDYDAQRIAKRLPVLFAALPERVRTAGAYHLVDAHACPYQGRRYLHFVFRGQGRTMSLFLEPRPQPLPDAPIETRLLSEFRVAGAATGEYQFFVVSDGGLPEDVETTRRVLDPAVRFVRSFSIPRRRRPRSSRASARPVRPRR